jgi:hypothetical protein
VKTVKIGCLKIKNLSFFIFVRYSHKLSFDNFSKQKGGGKMIETGTGRITSKNTVHQNIYSAFNGGNYLKLCKKNC